MRLLSSTTEAVPFLFSKIDLDKQAFRNTMRQKRQEYWRERSWEWKAETDRVICSIFLDAIKPPLDSTVGGYAAFSSEVDVFPVVRTLSDQGYSCALPCVIQTNNALVFRKWQPDDPLVPGLLGNREPFPTAPTVIPDILLVPLVAFDAEGYRLGMGKGYYDRTIAALRQRNPDLRAIGVAYSIQEVPCVPREPHDQRLDAVVTEEGMRWFR